MCNMVKCFSESGDLENNFQKITAQLYLSILKPPKLKDKKLAK